MERARRAVVHSDEERRCLSGLWRLFGCTQLGPVAQLSGPIKGTEESWN
jgi:hypothetical protein